VAFGIFELTIYKFLFPPSMCGCGNKDMKRSDALAERTKVFTRPRGSFPATAVRNPTEIDMDFLAEVCSSVL
jgi:hypothetical protein